MYEELDEKWEQHREQFEAVLPDVLEGETDGLTPVEIRSASTLTQSSTARSTRSTSRPTCSWRATTLSCDTGGTVSALSILSTRTDQNWTSWGVRRSLIRSHRTRIAVTQLGRSPSGHRYWAYSIDSRQLGVERDARVSQENHCHK